MQNQQEVGYVLSSRNYLVYLDGMPSIHINDLVVSDNGLRGVVNTLYETKIEVLMLDEGSVYPGQMFKKKGENLGLQVGDFLLGRMVNPLGVALDGKGIFEKDSNSKLVELDQSALGIESREFITTQFITGITLIDHLIPLGYGQRELVIGDQHSGIQDFLIDVIVNQNSSQTICIYAAIGKPATSIKNLFLSLEVNKALSHSVVIATSSTEPTPLIFITPLAALTVAQYFQQRNKNVVLILDDMGVHAKSYREISLLAGKAPGRESYPGDIFYQHARLLERAGRYNKAAGGGSITALPVIELNLIDFTGFTPTNLMAITDGHLLFKSNLYSKNQRPAIDIPLSVSRVGRQTQKLVNSLLSRRVRQTLAQADNLETISRFSGELPAATQLILRQKSLIEEVIRQEDLTFIPLEIQTILLGLIYTTWLADERSSLSGKNEIFLHKVKGALIEGFSKDPQLLKVTRTVLSLKNDDDLIKMLEEVSPKLTQLLSRIV